MSKKCSHGYFTHSQFNRCPLCYGVDQHNRNAIPVIGKGNGWLLKRGNPICQICGGPATAGWVVLPAGMTLKYYEKHVKPNIKECYYCKNNRSKFLKPSPGGRYG